MNTPKNDPPEATLLVLALLIGGGATWFWALFGMSPHVIAAWSVTVGLLLICGAAAMK